MENAAKEINGNYRKLVRNMRNFSVNDLDEVSMHTYKDEMKKFDEMFANLIDSIESFCDDFKVELGNEREKEWLVHRDKIESDVRSYKSSMKVKLAELWRNPSLSAGLDNSNSVSLQAEQLQQMKEQTNLTKQAQLARQEQQEESKREEEAKQKTSATARAKAKCEAVIADANELKDELITVDPSEWKQSQISL